MGHVNCWTSHNILSLLVLFAPRHTCSESHRINMVKPFVEADHEIRSTTGAGPVKQYYKPLDATDDLALAPAAPPIPVLLSTTSARAILDTRHRPPPLTLHNHLHYQLLPGAGYTSSATPYLKTANPGCEHDYYRRHLTPESTKSTSSPLIANVNNNINANVNLNDPALLSTAATKVSKTTFFYSITTALANQSFQIPHTPCRLDLLSYAILIRSQCLVLSFIRNYHALGGTCDMILS